MLVLGLDFETLGLDPKVHAICEVGAQLWDTDNHRAVLSMGYLVQVPEGAPFEEEAMKATKLPLELIAKYGKESTKALRQLLYMYEQADVIVAHNGNTCDRPFLLAWIKSCGLDFDEDKFWIDTLTDIEYPNKRWSRQLTCLAAYHGFLNPFPHQALADVMTTLTILDKYPIEEVLAYAKTPTIGIRLTIPFEKNQWGKDNGYFWYKDKENSSIKFWMKKIKANRLEEEEALVKEAGFSITQIEIPAGVY
jgi:DNA polymerase-3 subunit epsilon